MSGPVTTMPGGRIAPWDLAFLIESRRLRLFSKQAAQLSSTSRVIAKPILGGLHHEYGWAEAA